MANKPNTHCNIRKRAKKAVSIPVTLPHYKFGVEVIPCGPAAEGVTGACTLVRTGDIQFLIECGLYQKAGSIAEQYRVNDSEFPFDPKQIAFVVAGHCHGDHILRIPLLFHRGFRGPVYMPTGSKGIASILMYDSANIAERDAEELSRKKGRYVRPLYDEEDVEDALNHIVEIDMEQPYAHNQFVSIKYVPSGHILNAAQIELTVNDCGQEKTIVYTSDLGNDHIKKSFVEPFKPFTKADMFIGETTYAANPHVATQETREKDLETLRNKIEEVCMHRRGKVLIPCFANARSQEILVCLYQMFGDDPFFNVPIIYDSPMGVRICTEYLDLLEGKDYDLFWKAMNWRNVRFMDSALESTAWRKDPSPAIVIASSGMMDFGRSKDHAFSMMGNSKNAIIFCGFAVEGSLAYQIKYYYSEDNKRPIKLNGQQCYVRCNVLELASFSSHMQSDSLLKYYSDIQCNRLILMHGDLENRVQFMSDLIRERKRKGNLGFVYQATIGEVFRV